MPGTTELRTVRLLLRRHVMEDSITLRENFGKDPAMSEYSGWNPYFTPEMAEKTVREFIESYSNPRFYGWAMECEGRLVGTIGAYNYDAERSLIEVGMSVEKASWGKGYATEALAAVLHYLADEEKIATVTAWCAADNIGSQRVMEKAGMVKMNIEKDALEVEGSTYDKLWYEFHGESAEKSA